MPFSNEDNALRNNLYHQFNEYGSRRIVTEFLKINRKREEVDIAEKDVRNRKHRPYTTLKQAVLSKNLLYLLSVSRLVGI